MMARPSRGTWRVIMVLTILFVAGAALFGARRVNAAQRSREAQALTGGVPDRGARAIRAYGCSGCHTIPGIPGATGLVGPSLAGVAQRVYLGGVLTHSPDNLVRWIMTPQDVDSLPAMPNLGVTLQEARDIAAYLYSLP